MLKHILFKSSKYLLEPRTFSFGSKKKCISLKLGTSKYLLESKRNILEPSIFYF